MIPVNVANPMKQRADETVRLDAWRSVFEKTNRIISERPVTVKVVTDVPGGMEDIPGWSDGEAVHFNGPVVLEMLRSHDPIGAVLRLKGLNYHELSHVLYTPRMTDELPKRVVERATTSGDRTWWWAFNALEDQRIETWFTASYGPSRRYFEAAVLQWLVKDGNAEAAILTYGRKYLPARIRVQAGRVFVQKYGQPLYDEFKAVIDQYLLVVLPAESVRGLTLVTKYRELLLKMQKARGCGLPGLPVPDNGCHPGAGNVPDRDDPSVIRCGRVLVKAAKDAKKRAGEDIKAAAKADAKAKAEIESEQPKPGESPGEGAGKPQPAEQPGDKPGEQPGEGQGESQGQGQGEGDKPSEGEGDSPNQGQGGTTEAEAQPGSGQGAGGGTGEHHVIDAAELDAAIKDMIAEAEDGLDDIADDEGMREDAERVLAAVKSIANNGNIGASGGLAKNRGTTAATPDHLIAIRRIVGILTRIKQIAEPQILRGRPAGRVDLRRLIGQRPNDFDIFTTYDEGAEEEAGIEAVVLLDVSGSMNHCMAEASAAVWVLKRAFDRLDIRTTCLVYDTDHYVLYQPTEKAKVRVPIVSTMGGTDPTSALQQALVIFGKSHLPNKVLITVTDGQWQGRPENYVSVMKAMKRAGVTSMLLGLQGAERRYGRHYHTIGHDLTEIKDLPKAALKLVGQIMRTATNQV